jgi:hypothetical protein
MRTAYRLNNLDEYRQYFERLTAEATFLNFFAYTKSDFEKASSDPARNGWCFILEPYTASITDNEADSVLSYPRGMFVITKKKTSEKKHWQIEDEAQTYAHKIIGRMRRDRDANLILTEFSNFSLETIDPIGLAGYFGVIVQFNFYFPINKEMKYVAEDWETIEYEDDEA